MNAVASAVSLCVPGVGQWLQRRWLDGLLFFWFAMICHVVAMGAIMNAGGEASRVEALLLGPLAPAAPKPPVAVVFSLLAWITHVWAAKDTVRRSAQGDAAR